MAAITLGQAGPEAGPNRASSGSSLVETSSNIRDDGLETKTIVEADSTEDVEAVARTETQPEAIYSVFSLPEKRLIVALATISSLFSPLTSFIYLPAIETLAKYYDTSVASINLSVTTYQIFQGVAPMFFGNMADTIGRRPVYVAAFTVYLFANLGLALQNNYAALLVLRSMQSAGSAATIALGNAVVADVSPPSERAVWMGYVTAGVLLGPAIAPTLGGIFAQFLGWRWIFWFLLILICVYIVIYLVINPETCRNIVDDGSLPPPTLNKTIPQLLAQRKSKDAAGSTLSEKQQQKMAELKKKRGKIQFPNPIASLKCIKEPDVAMILLYQAIMISGFYCIMVPITPVFAATYGFNELQIGLCYIPFAAGAAGGSIIFGRLLNWNFARTARKLGMKVDRKRASRLREFPIEKARLEFVYYPNALAAAGLLCWGWALERNSNLAGPLIIMVFTAFGSTGSSVIVNTLLVDLYPEAPATVIAANNLVRCVIAAGASAVIQYMIDALGLGWCYTLVAGIVILSTAFLTAAMKYGPRWREARTVRLEQREAKEKARQSSEST